LRQEQEVWEFSAEKVKDHIQQMAKTSEIDAYFAARGATL